MTFRQQVVLITGGSSGIGLSTARLLAAEGAHVWLVARNRERLAEALETLHATSLQEAGVLRLRSGQTDGPNSAQDATVDAASAQRHGIAVADVSDPVQAQAAVARVCEQAGVPDIVINSHGVTHPGYFQDLDLAIFREMMEINYFGALHIIRAVVPGMMARGSGHIVNVASGAALVGSFGYSAYSASKHALRGLSDVLRIELKPHHIDVSVVYPPDTDTPQLAYEAPLKPVETREIYGGVIVSPDFVARAILDGIRRHSYSIIPGAEMAAIAKVAGVLGDGQFSVLDRMVARVQRKQRRSDPNGQTS